MLALGGLVNADECAAQPVPHYWIKLVKPVSKRTAEKDMKALVQSLDAD
jgi:hypothetical protein